MPLSKIPPAGQAQYAGARNLIINGAMQVAQRGTSTTGLQNSGGVFTIDRFSHRRGGTWSNAQFKHEQVDATVTGETTLNKALKVTCTTAEGSVPASGEAVAIGTYLEKGDTHRLGVGTSTALKSTLSFYARASIATTYGVEIQGYQHSTTQAIRIPFTISSANTWERISVSIPADTAALDSDADNTQGWLIHFVLDAEASSDTASTWASLGSSGVSLPNGVSTTTFSNTLNATFEITGVQLEVGEQATPFEHRSYADELRRCSRYYTDIVRADDQTAHLVGYVQTSIVARFGFHVSMRTTPTISETNFGILYGVGNEEAITSIDDISQDEQFLSFRAIVSGNLTTGQAVALFSNGAASLTFDAEL